MHFLRKGDISWRWAFGVRAGAYGERNRRIGQGDKGYDERLGLL